MILSVFIASGCSLRQSVQRNKQCKGIEEAFSPHWVRIRNAPNSYDVSRDGMKELEGFRSCILLLRKKDVIRIFGHPSKETGNKMYYFLFGCQSVNESSCTWMEFHFDRENVSQWKMKVATKTAN